MSPTLAPVSITARTANTCAVMIELPVRACSVCSTGTARCPDDPATVRARRGQDGVRKPCGVRWAYLQCIDCKMPIWLRYLVRFALSTVAVLGPKRGLEDGRADREQMLKL